MNNKFLKILTGVSAIFLSTLLSNVTVHAEQNGTVDQGYSRTVQLRNALIVDDTSPDYLSSINLEYICYSAEGNSFDNMTTNIWLDTGDTTSSDFIIAVAAPYNMSSFTFAHYYYERQSGPINHYEFEGKDILIFGTTYEGYFDVYFTTVFSDDEPDGIPALENEDNTIKDFYISIDNTVNDIIKAASGLNHDGSENPQKVVFYNYNGAINYRIINALAKTQGVTLLYTFEYQGYVFTSAITSENAANIILENEDWYGSCYIAQNCPTALVGVAQ